MYSRIGRLHQRKFPKSYSLFSSLMVATLGWFSYQVFHSDVYAQSSESFVRANQTSGLKKNTSYHAPIQPTTITTSQAQTQNQTEANTQDTSAETTTRQLSVSEPESQVVHKETEVSKANNPVTIGHSATLTNGNTVGEQGRVAAAQMATATGVPQETWEYIIARESNGQVYARNTSGASGLFQTMPGWGSTATVEDQINTAINVYKSQGLAAWGMK